jgi:four helix bundle protein
MASGTANGGIRSYKDLDVWQVAMTLAEACYRLTARFPRDEAFGITSQMRRAAVSIASNIAEGYGRESTASYVQFLRIAQGSLKELETLVMLAKRVELLSEAQSAQLLTDCERVSKMLRNLIRSLQAGKS